jgi:hypothetical protein
MTKANGNCNRCSGRGMRDTPVVHLGVPGLCYGCDGDGTYATYAKKVADGKKQKALMLAQQVVMAKVWEGRLEAEALGMKNDRSKETWAWIKEHRGFSTKEFAEAKGLSCKEAWLTLCLKYPSVGPVWDEAGAATGWESYC